MALEPGFPSSIADGLAERGHKVKYMPSYHPFGGAQIILNHADGYVAGSDHRRMGQLLDSNFRSHLNQNFCYVFGV